MVTIKVRNGGIGVAPLIRAFAALLAIALMSAWTLAVLPGAHGAPRADVAAEFHHAATDNENHGIAHDDGDTGTYAGGHMIGHDAADHSHQLAFAASGASQPPDQGAGSWLTPPSQPIKASAVSGIDRPPKVAASA